MEDLLRPECWASVAKMLQPWSHIEVPRRRRKLLRRVARDRRGIAPGEGRSAEFQGNSALRMFHSRPQRAKASSRSGTRRVLRWHIIRKSDRHIVKDNMQLRMQAEEGLA